MVMINLSHETLLQARVQGILNDKSLDDGDKSMAAYNIIKENLREGLRKKGRMLFGANTWELERISLATSVAMEELHACYLRHCSVQASVGVGAMYVVYGDAGMGKSLASLSLLVHRHGRAPRRGIYLGGSNSFQNGEEYFNHLLDTLLTGDGQVPKRLSELGCSHPRTIAPLLFDALPVERVDGSIKAGIQAIPGLRDYLKTGGENGLAEWKGGSPVIVLDDVNIRLSDINPQLSKGEQFSHWLKELGKAAVFLERIMTLSYNTAVVSFVTTKEINLARFLFMLNDMEKGMAFKCNFALKRRDILRDDLSCLQFAWDNTARERFLRLQNDALQDGSKLNDEQILTILHENKSASISEMTSAFHDIASQDNDLIAPSLSREIQETGCGFCFIHLV